MRTSRLNTSHASIASTIEDFTPRSSHSTASSEITYNNSDSNLIARDSYNLSDEIKLYGTKGLHRAASEPQTHVLKHQNKSNRHRSLNIFPHHTTHSKLEESFYIPNHSLMESPSDPDSPFIAPSPVIISSDKSFTSSAVTNANDSFVSSTFISPNNSFVNTDINPNNSFISSDINQDNSFVSSDIISPDHSFISLIDNIPAENDEFAAVPDEKFNNPCKEFFLSILKFLVAICSSSTFAINSEIGAGKSESLVFPNFKAPKNLADLTKTGFTGPWYFNAFALNAGIWSLIVNICQFYDFAPQLREGYNSHIQPILKKIYDGRFKELTKKEYNILFGMALSITAAIASGKIAWDATKDSPEWYFRILLGASNVLSTFGMTFLTRSVSTKRLIDNTAFFYSKDKRHAFNLFKELAQAKTKLQNGFFIPPNADYLIDNADREEISEWFIKFGMDIPSDIDNVILTAKNNFLTACETFDATMKKGTLSLFALNSVAIAWYIYMQKLDSLLPILEAGATAKICWDTICSIFSLIGATPHLPLFAYATLEIPGNIKKSFSISPARTILAILGTLPTSFGFLNVCRSVLENSRLITFSSADTPIGLSMQILAFMAAYVVNLNSLLKILILKGSIKEQTILLKENPYHEVVQKIIREEPVHETTMQNELNHSATIKVRTHRQELTDESLSSTTLAAQNSKIKTFVYPSVKSSSFFKSATPNNDLKEALLDTASKTNLSQESNSWYNYIRSFCGSRGR